MIPCDPASSKVSPSTPEAFDPVLIVSVYCHVSSSWLASFAKGRVSFSTSFDVVTKALDVPLAAGLSRRLLLHFLLSETRLPSTLLPSLAVDPCWHWLLADCVLSSRPRRMRLRIGLRDGRHAKVGISDFVCR